MKHIPHCKAKRFENDSVTSWEYELQNASLNIARISITGRDPENGFTSNSKSDSIVQIVKGTGLLTIDNGTVVKLDKDDQVHLAIGDVYYFEGNLEIIYAATPPWTPEQTIYTS